MPNDFEAHLDLFDNASEEAQYEHFLNGHGIEKADLRTNSPLVEQHYRDHALGTGLAVRGNHAPVALEDGGVIPGTTVLKLYKGTREEAEAEAQRTEDWMGGRAFVGKHLEGVDAWEILLAPPERMAEGGIVDDAPNDDEVKRGPRETCRSCGRGYWDDRSGRLLHFLNFQHDPADYKKLAEGGIVDPDEESLQGMYAVVENMPGYLPESDPAIFATEREANEYAAEQRMELHELGLDEQYVVEVIPLQDGAALVENVGDGVPAIVGEAGPEAVIPLDDPDAVEVMADAIEEADAAPDDSPDVEVNVIVDSGNVEVVEDVTEEVVEEIAEAEEVEALADAVEEIAESNADVAESGAEAIEEVAEAEAVAAVAGDRAPRSGHWSQRPLFGKRR